MKHENKLLALLTEPEWHRVEPHLFKMHLERGDRLAEPQSRIHRAYFPHSGVLSFVVDLPGGGAVETAIVGNDGIFGAAQALNDQLCLNSVVVQSPGEASVIEIGHLRDLAIEFPRLRKLITGYEVFLFAHAQQTAACNALHKIRERTCKWLARMQDVAGNELPLTQEFIAQMMGVRRASVSEVAQELQKHGLIEYHRGSIKIRNAEALRRCACDCYHDVAAHYAVITGVDPIET